jgi:cysteine dioxygenase
MSPLHNHKGSICAVQVLVGDALEVGYEKSDSGYFSPRELSRFAAGEVAVSEDEEIHQFGNANSTPMVSLHLYSPPLTLAETFPETASILTAKSFASMHTQGNFTLEAWVHPYV